MSLKMEKLKEVNDLIKEAKYKLETKIFIETNISTGKNSPTDKQQIISAK